MINKLCSLRILLAEFCIVIAYGAQFSCPLGLAAVESKLTCGPFVKIDLTFTLNTFSHL